MMQGLQAMKDSAALLVYWDGEASDISWPEPCIVEYVTNGQGGINSMSKEAVRCDDRGSGHVGSRLDKYWQYQKKISPSDINGENRHADSDR